ncbi:MAG: hypothetical protein L6Q92_12035 [Phycisphaerae bacterium]|nr:hypothetical protein [Phycisphaerae bacterium]
MAETPDDARRSWPLFNTPLRSFLAVVAPVRMLMLPLALVARSAPAQAFVEDAVHWDGRLPAGGRDG